MREDIKEDLAGEIESSIDIDEIKEALDDETATENFTTNVTGIASELSKIEKADVDTEQATELIEKTVSETTEIDDEEKLSKVVEILRDTVKEALAD